MAKAIGNNIDYSGNCIAPVETETEIKALVAEKMAIIDDFLVGKKRLKGDARAKFEEYLLSLNSMRAIDVYFRNYVNAHM